MTLARTEGSMKHAMTRAMEEIAICKLILRHNPLYCGVFSLVLCAIDHELLPKHKVDEGMRRV